MDLATKIKTLIISPLILWVFKEALPLFVLHSHSKIKSKCFEGPYSTVMSAVNVVISELNGTYHVETQFFQERNKIMRNKFLRYLVFNNMVLVLVLLLVLLIVGVMLYMPLILGLVNTPHIIHTRDMRTDKKLKAINSIPSMLLNPFEYFFGINMSCEEIQDDTMPLLLDDEDPNSPEANAVPE